MQHDGATYQNPKIKALYCQYYYYLAEDSVHQQKILATKMQDGYFRNNNNKRTSPLQKKPQNMVISVLFPTSSWQVQNTQPSCSPQNSTLFLRHSEKQILSFTLMDNML